MNPCSFLVCLMIILATIVNADQNLTIPNKYDGNDHRRSLQSSNSFSTALTTLTASNGGIDNYFGNFNGVAISNNRIVVGAFGYNGNTGAAYLFMDPNAPSTGRSYSQMAILTASDGATDDFFGTSVDIDGDIIVVGAHGVLGFTGAVYVFRIVSNNIITQLAKITARNGATTDEFGRSLANNGNFILAGAFGVYKNGISDVGSAYLFVNPSNDPNNPEWTQIMQFQPNDLTENDKFGWSVSMDDQIAVIGTYDGNANAAYVFAPVDENADSLSLWSQMAKLTGPTGSLFGYSVAVAGNSMVVGAHNDGNGGSAGAVFVFTNIDDTTFLSSSSSWSQTNILLAADGAERDYFGRSVSISKDASTIVVGAEYDDYDSTIQDSGSVYLFQKSDATMTVGWTQVGKYVAVDRDAEDNWGSSIAIENSIVVVGVPGDNTAAGGNFGSAYVIDTGYSTSTTKPSPSIPWNQIFPLAALGVLILGFMGCLLL